MRPNKDEAAVLSLRVKRHWNRANGNKGRLREAIDRVEFVQPSGMLPDGVVVSGPHQSQAVTRSWLWRRHMGCHLRHIR